MGIKLNRGKSKLLQQKTPISGHGVVQGGWGSSADGSLHHPRAPSAQDAKISSKREIIGCIFLNLCGFNPLNHLQNAIPRGLRFMGRENKAAFSW